MMQPVHLFGSPPDAPGRRFLNNGSSGSSPVYQKQLDVLAREVQANPGFQDSIALQTRWRAGLSSYNQEAAQDNRSRLMSLRTNAWREIQDFTQYYRTHFEANAEREIDNWNFYYGYQWDDAELKTLQKIALTPHVSNFMSRWARTLIGEKRGAQTQFMFESEDEAFKPVTELYNQVCGKIARANEWQHKSGDAFANLAIAGRCVMSVRPDPYQPFSRIQMRNERYQEFMYDFEHAQDGTGDGMNYMMRSYYRDLEEVIFMYPEWEDFLLNYDYGSSSNIEHLLSFTVSQPKIPPTAFKRVVDTPQRFIQRPYFQRRRTAWITEFYRLQGVRQFTVTDGNFNIQYDFAAPDMAAHFYRNLRDASIARNIALTGQPGLDLVVEPQSIVRRELDVELWCSDVLLDAHHVRVDRFPYVLQHNEFHDGQWRGFFEDDKPNQKMKNKMLVLLDMMMGGLKGKDWYDSRLFGAEMSDDKIQKFLRDPTKAGIFKGKEGMDVKNMHFRTNPNEAFDAGMMKTMTEWIDKASNFANGGLNLVGDAEFAGQSDRLRRGLQQSSQTGIVGLTQDMERAEIRVGENLVYTAQNLHPTVLLQYANSEDRARFLPLLQNMSHSVEMDQITMQVEEVLSGPTRSDQQSSALLEVAGQDPAMLQDVMPEIMTLRRFPQSMVDRINKRQSDRQDAMSQQAQQEARLEQAQAEAKIQVADRKVAVEEGLLDVKRHPPVTFGVVSKANAPGPDAMAEIYKQHQINADPMGIIASESKQDLKDQLRDNLRQESFDARDIPYQKALAKLHPTEKKPKKTSDGLRSPKDRSNRSRKKAERPTTQV